MSAKTKTKVSAGAAAPWINKNRKKSVSAASKAGLVVAPAHARRELSKYKMNISATAPVYIAAQCEYILAEIAELAIKVATDNNRKRVTVSDLSTAIRSDRELSLAVGDMAFSTSHSLGRSGPGELGMLFV